MKVRVQPKDLFFDLLKTLIFEDCPTDNAISVTCPELQRTITNDRNFQMAIHVLLERGSKIKFMFSDDELMSLKVLARSMRRLLSQVASTRTPKVWTTP